MRPNLPTLKDAMRKASVYLRDIKVNGITVGRGKNSIATNTATGSAALQLNTTGSQNTATGYQALRTNTTGSQNTAGGYGALSVNTTGGTNTATGYGALQSNTTGGSNTATGSAALASNTTGSQNTATGFVALQLNTTGSQNTATGYYALSNNTTGNFNTATGYYALYSQNNPTITAGSFVVGASYIITSVGTTNFMLIGAVSSSVGTVFTATGAGTGTGTATLNHQSVADGYNASYNNLSGHNTTSIGFAALFANTAYYNVTGVGANTAVTGSNQVQLGDSATTTYAYGAVQDRSDIRDKADVRDTTLGLEFINSIRPVDFRWDKREDYRTDAPVKTTIEKEEFETDESFKSRQYAIDADFKIVNDAWLESNKLENITHDGSKKRNRYHHGVIAQELPTGFGGLQHHAINGGDDVYSVGYEEFIAPLIKAIQELSTRLDVLEAK